MPTSDDFHVDPLNTTLWSTVDDPQSDSTVSIEGEGTADAVLQIALPSGTEHDTYAGDTATKVLQSITDDTDWTVVVKFESKPGNGQLQGIFVRDAADHDVWIRFDIYGSGGSVFCFAAHRDSGSSASTIFNTGITAASGGQRYYLRITRSGTSHENFDFDYSYDGTNWNTGGTSELGDFVATQIGVYAGNFDDGSGVPAWNMQADYFEDTNDPITDEDPVESIAGTAAGVATVSGTVTGVGAVAGTVAGTSTVSGTVVGYMPGGTAAGIATVSGTVTGINGVVGQAAGAATVSGIITGVGAVAGTAAGTGTAAATVAGDGAVSSEAAGAASVSGTVVGFGAIAGTAAGTATASMVPAQAVPQSDDFHTGSLNTELWTILDPVGNCSVALTGANSPDAYLELSVPAGTDHDAGSPNEALQVVQTIQDVDFEVEAKFDSIPSADIQDQGIMVRTNDADTFLRTDLYWFSGNLRLYCESRVDDVPTTYANTVVTAAGSSVWLRITRSGSSWTVRYSDDGATFSTLASFSLSIPVSAVGPFAGNFDASLGAPAFTAKVDYFFNTASPISPEDPPGGLAGTAAGVATVSGTVTGVGAVAGTADGTATATALLNAVGVAGTAAGAATVSGTVTGIGAIRSASYPITTGLYWRGLGSEDSFPRAHVSGTLSSAGVVGTAVGFALVLGTVTARGNVAGATAGSSTVGGTVKGAGRIAGTAVGTSAVGAVVKALGTVAGTAAGAATISGRIAGGIRGTASGVGVVGGTVKGSGVIAGTAAGAATVSGTVGYESAVEGTAAGAATVSGTLSGTGAIAGAAAGIATVSGNVRSLAGTAAGAATVAGTVTGIGVIAGTAAGSAVVSGVLDRRLNGTAAGAATVSGTVRGIGKVAGTAAGVATVSGEIHATQVTGVSAGKATVIGRVKGVGVIAGAAAGAATVSGALLSHPLPLPGVRRTVLAGGSRRYILR